jgi:hypothetical protein
LFFGSTKRASVPLVALSTLLTVSVFQESGRMKLYL